MKNALWLLLVLLLARASGATESLSLSQASGSLTAGSNIKLLVTGDSLRRVTIRLFRLKGTDRGSRGDNTRAQVLEKTQTSDRPRSSMSFALLLPAPGRFQAVAFADGNPASTATDEITFSVAPRPAPAVPTLELSGPDNIAPLGKTTFEAQGTFLKSATLRAWKLLPGGQQKQVLQQFKPMPLRPRAGSKEAASYEPVIKWSVPMLSPGAYLLEATSSTGLKKLLYSRASDIGLVSKRAPGEMLVYAVRLSDGAPIPNVAVRVDDSGVSKMQADKSGRLHQVLVRAPQPSRAALTSGDGVAVFSGTPGDGTLKIAASAPDGSRASGHEAFVQDSESSDIKVLFYTERPLYRPGQTVFFKGTARRDLARSGKRGANNALFAPVPNAPVELEFTDAANEKFATLKARTDANGAFAGQIVLRDNAAVGRYAVETKLTPNGTTSGARSESFFNRFLVQEYRKPEYEVTLEPQLREPFAVQGTSVQVLVRARYFFGGAVKGAKLEYTGSASGTTTLNDNGEALITLQNPTPEASELSDTLRDHDRTLSLSAKVTDDANRIVQSETSIFAPYALLRPALSFDKSVYDLQQTAKIIVHTRDPLGRAAAGSARVRLFYTREKRVFNRETMASSVEYEDVVFFSRSIATDRFGSAALEVKLTHAGYIGAEVSATDSLNRTRTFKTNVWVLSKEQPDYYWGRYEFPQVQVLVDKTSYKPGDTVRALLTTSKSRGWVLLTLQGDRIFFHRVIKLTGRVTPLNFAFPEAAAPGAFLVAGTSQGRGWAQDSAYVKAVSPAQTLNIALQPDKHEYRPGTKATYHITVKDGLGRPQQADVSFGLVDKAIYSLAQDETPDPVEFFFGSRENRVSTTWQFPGEVAGGAYQRIEKAVLVRRNFQDTAFWRPFVSTSAAGTATLSLDLPDNLTQWRATARGLTSDTKAGAALDDITVTKPLLTRLILPRFLSQTDRVRAQVIVQNNTQASQNVRVSLRGDKIQVASVGAEEKGAQSRAIAAGQSASFFWTVGTDDVPVGQRGFLVATARTGAEATGEDSDAQQLPLAIQPRGFPVQKWATAIVRDNERTLSLAQAPGFVPNASRLEISLSPSVAGPMLGALPSLIDYPYGCTEQTLSRFAPSMAAARALKYLKLPTPEAAQELPKIVEMARSTLYSYQHKDGGWGWWPDDATDPYLTAYAVYGLALSKQAGYEIDRERVLRGVTSIQNQFAGAPDADGRAFLMLAYATARQTFGFKKDELEAKNFLGAVFEFRSKLSPYGLASLALAHSRMLEAARVQSAAQTPRMVTLSGEAALAYVRKTRVGVDGTKLPPGVQAYLSRNGGIYYRDPKSPGIPIYLVPPRWGLGSLQVPETAAAGLEKLAGYKAPLAPASVADLQAADGALGTAEAATLRAHLNTLLDDLEARARREQGPNGPVASWPSELPNASGWNDSDIEATALSLQVLARERPNSNLIAPIVSWLLQSRRGVQWRSTKDTAQVVIALADYLQITRELDADEAVQVLVNGQLQRELHFTRADVGKPDALIALDGLNADASISIRRTGRGVVYAASKLTSFETPSLKTGADNGFKITRHFQLQDAKGRWRDVSGPIPSGALVRVDLRVSVANPLEYVLLEDWAPSGFEARPEDDKLAQKVERKCDCGGDSDDLVVVDPPPNLSPLPTSRRESRDNRQAWFVDRLDRGSYYLRYILRPEQSGTRVALPARAEAMYRPEINGHSDESVLEVK